MYFAPVSHRQQKASLKPRSSGLHLQRVVPGTFFLPLPLSFLFWFSQCSTYESQRRCQVFSQPRFIPRCQFLERGWNVLADCRDTTQSEKRVVRTTSNGLNSHFLPFQDNNWVSKAVQTNTKLLVKFDKVKTSTRLRLVAKKSLSRG